MTDTFLQVTGFDPLVVSAPAGTPGQNGAPGTSLTSASIDNAGHLILTLSNGQIVDAGAIASGTILSDAGPDPTQRALRHYHAALAGRESSPVDIFFAAGDSLFASAGATTFANSLGQKFIKLHRQTYPQTAAGGVGSINPLMFGSTAQLFWPDTPTGYNATSYFSPGVGVPGWGLTSSTAYLSSTGTYEQFIFTGTGIDLSWFSSGNVAGAATLTVDGTVYGVYNAGTKALTAGAGTINATAGNNVLAHGKIRGLSAGAHVVQFTWASGTFYVNDAFAYNGDEASGARVAVAAYPGKGTRNYVGATYGGTSAANPFPAGTQAEQWRQHIRDGSYLPDLIFVDNMANDYAGSATDLCTPVQNLANLRAIIANLKADVAVGCAAAGVATYVPSFVIIPPHCVVTSNIGAPSGNGGTMVAVWQDYVTNAYTIASTDPDKSVALFDLGLRLQGSHSNTWDNDVYDGLLWSGDKVHPSDVGNEWWARALLDFIRPQ